MRGIVCSLLLLLSACATPRSPGIKIEYVDRPVIQVQKCLKAGDVPTRPSKLGGAPTDLERALSLALAKISEWTRYGNKMDVIAKGCVQTEPVK